jgi:hypothetical protein
MQHGSTPVVFLPQQRIAGAGECFGALAWIRHRLWLALTAIILLTGRPPAALGADALSITFADTTIRIPSGASNWTRKDIVIKGENLDPAVVGSNPALSYQDLYVDGPADLVVKLKNLRTTEGNGKSRVWLADAEISNLPPDSAFKRRMLFTYGNISVPIDYTVTNRPEGTFTWSVKPALKELVLKDSREISLIASTGDTAATNVHLAMSSLQDDATKDALGREYLQLCIVNGPDCSPAPFSLTARASSHPMKLKVDKTFCRPGVFKGMIWIAVDQKQDPDSFELTVYSTRSRWQFFGALCIVLGVVLWWFIAVFARQRAARAEALLPLAELSESIDDLLSSLDQTEHAGNYHMRCTRERLDRIKRELDPKTPALSPLIPESLPSVSGLTTDTTAGLKQYIDTRAAQVAALSVLVRQGGSAVLSKQEEATNAGQRDLIRNALKALDKAAEEVNTVDEARSKLRDIINNIETELAGKTEQDIYQGISGSLAFVPSLPTTKELRLETKTLSLGVWMVWGAATVAVGVGALILTNYGFGTALDYLKCFLWGLSIQAVGQQLQQLTPGSVVTSLKIPVSK